MKLLGIDEAGRGPVIGPLVIAGVVINADKLKELEKIGVKDSKKLSKKKRDELFKHLMKYPHYVIKLTPKEIDSTLKNPSMNLNLLELINVIKILTNLEFDIAYLDCPTSNLKRFCEEMLNFLTLKNAKIEVEKEIKGTQCNILGLLKNREIRIVVSNKADERFIPVAAASIIAKVTRDREIEKIKKHIGIDFGSGYPSDPKTKEFIQKYFDKYDIFRKTWQTWKDANLKKQTLLDFINNTEKNKEEKD